MSDEKPKPSTTYGAAADSDLGALTCPSCGVAVPKGYLKCPKCHATMPRSRSPLGRAHTEAGGGTSVSAGRTLSLRLILVVAALTALIVHIANREDTTPQARSPVVVASDEFDQGDEPGGEQPAAGALDGGALGEAEAPGQNLAEVSFVPLDQLYEALAAIELFTWVDVSQTDRSAIELRSWYCDNADLVSAVDKAARELQAGGFASVSCFERDGKLVFERVFR